MPLGSLPNGWNLVDLGSVCRLPDSQVKPPEFQGYENYVGLEDIESGTGRIIAYRNVHEAELKSSKFPFDSSCILYGKLRPYLNKVAIPDAMGICSTDILPLKPNTRLISKEFLYYYLRSPNFVKTASEKSTGANLPRITPSILTRIQIPLPPIETQEMITHILLRADRLVQLRRQTNQLTNRIVQSVFFRMFGDPSVNPMGWVLAQMGEVCSKITDGEHVTPQRTTAGVMLLSARNVKHGYIDLGEEVDYIPQSEYERIRKRCNPEYGDVLLSCSGTVGRAAVVDIREPFTLVRSVALLKPRRDRVTPEYLQGFLQSESAQGEIRRRANQSSQANIFQRQIRSLNILVPPLDLQAGFSGFVASLKMTIERQKESARALDELFQSLMHKAFRGELTVA